MRLNLTPELIEGNKMGVELRPLLDRLANRAAKAACSLVLIQIKLVHANKIIANCFIRSFICHQSPLGVCAVIFLANSITVSLSAFNKSINSDLLLS